MHETKSKMYAPNYVVPGHHTYSGYATAFDRLCNVSFVAVAVNANTLID